MTDNQPLSRRQRLLGIARSTRDNYIPKITGSVSSLATGATRAFLIQKFTMIMGGLYYRRIRLSNCSPLIPESKMINTMWMYKDGFSPQE